MNKNEEKNPGIGDKVKIITPDEEIEGTLIASSEPSLVVIKLKSGYNIGIKKENIINMKLIEEAETREEKLKIKKRKICLILIL